MSVFCLFWKYPKGKNREKSDRNVRQMPHIAVDSGRLPGLFRPARIPRLGHRPKAALLMVDATKKVLITNHIGGRRWYATYAGDPPRIGDIVESEHSHIRYRVESVNHDARQLIITGELKK